MLKIGKIVALAAAIHVTPLTAQQNDTAALLTMAIQGDADAQADLAYSYYAGVGIAQDYEKAFEWYSRAAAQGNANAQYSLGVLYLTERGTPFDADGCFNNYLAAAEQGLAEAEASMSYLYYERQCIPETDEATIAQKTAFWSRLSAQDGDAASIFRLGFTLMNWPDLQEYPTEAEDMLLQADAAGIEVAKESLAYLYEVGISGSPDLQKAATYRSAMAKAGNAEAATWLTENGFDGDGAPLEAAAEVAESPVDGAGPEDANYAAALTQLTSFEPDFDAVIDLMAPLAAQGERRAIDYMLEAISRAGPALTNAQAIRENWIPQFADMGHPVAMFAQAFDIAMSEQPLGDAQKVRIRALLAKIDATDEPRNQTALEQFSRDIIDDDPAQWTRPLSWYLQRADDPYAQYQLYRIYDQRRRNAEDDGAQEAIAAMCWLSRALTTQERLPFLNGENWHARTTNNEPNALPETDEAMFLACEPQIGMTTETMIDRAIAIEAGTVTNPNPFPDRHVAASWLRLAAMSGNPEAQNRYALYLQERDKFIQAREWSRIAAEQGNAEAQFYHAVWTLHYADVNFNEPQPDLIAEAMAWLNLSASQGFALAQREISIAYTQGEIIPANETLAVLWADRADASGAPKGDAYDAFLKVNNWGLNPR